MTNFNTKLNKILKYLNIDQTHFDISSSFVKDTEFFKSNIHKEYRKATYHTYDNKLHLYAYNVSGHNGDHYDDSYYTISNAEDKNIIKEVQNYLINYYGEKCKDEAYKKALEKRKTNLIVEELLESDLEFLIK